MKYFRLILLLSIMSLLFSAGMKNNNKPVPISAHASPKYEIQLTYTGYTTLYGDAVDCKIRPNGTAILTGMVAGTEEADHCFYKGVLQLKIDMDICSAMRLSTGEDQFCSMRVTGKGPVNAEIEIDTATGAYIKIDHDPRLGKFEKNVTGSCDTTQVKEEETMVPNKSIACIFNGMDLPMLKNKLRVGKKFIVAKSDAGVTELLVSRVINP